MRTLAEPLREPNRFARDLFDGLPRRYDALAEVLSFGQNRRWRKAMVDVIATMRPAPTSILDVATGTCGVALMLSKRTGAHVTGLDITEPMLRRGEQAVRRAGASDRISLVLAGAERLPFPDATFDALTFTYLMRYVADPEATIRELARVVRPGGTIACLEFAVPSNRLLRAGWLGYTRVVLPLAGYLTGGREWFEVGRFLGPSISEHYRRYPLSWTQDVWRGAGLESVTARPMSLGGGLVMWARRVGD